MPPISELVIHDRNYIEFERVRVAPKRALRPLLVDNLMAKRAANMKMGQRQVKEAQRQDEEALTGGRFPHWWKSGITGTKRVRLEEEEEAEFQPPKRRRRRQ